MTSPERHTDAQQAPSSAKLLILLGLVLAVGVFTALLAVLAGIFGWHRSEMLVAGGGIGGFMAALAVLLLYGQMTERRAANQALQNIEARVGDIVESAMDAIITVDEQQRIVLFNPAAEKVFGRPRGTVLGQSLDLLIPERFRQVHHGHITHYAKTGILSRRMGDQTVLTGLRANAEEFPIEASVSQHTENSKRLFTVILRDVTERVQAVEALRKSKDELRDFAIAASSVREQEKSRIARELHDELAQSLTALKMDTVWLMERLPALEPVAAKKLAAMQSLLDATVAATRRISADLRPLMLDDLGLAPATEWLAQNFTQRTGIPCELLVDGDLTLADPHATAIFRILQESLTNVSKHAQATRVNVTLGRIDGAVSLSVSDNGCGFSTTASRKPNSYGLLGLRERAYLLGGEVNITSSPGSGTRIAVHVPIEAARPS